MTTALETSKGSQRREQILVVARKLLVEEGYDRFVLREIAARSGMTIGNLQYYFRTRDLLLEAVIRITVFDDLEALEAIAENGRQGKAQLREVTSMLLRNWSGDSGKVYAAASFLSYSQPLFRSMFCELYWQLYEHLILMLKKLHPRAHRQTLLDKARLITALLDGAVIQLRHGAVPTTPGAQARFIEDICAQVVAIGSQ